MARGAGRPAAAIDRRRQVIFVERFQLLPVYLGWNEGRLCHASIICPSRLFSSPFGGQPE